MTRWSEQDLAVLQARRTGKPVSAPRRTDQALGRLPTGKMNATEAAYSEHLRLLQIAGEIRWFKFEGIKLRLADKTFLTVDFAVLMADGTLELREVKGGFIYEDANVKLKVAAAMYPFKFVLVRKKKNGWDHREISRGP